jgi:hypothetical protein
VLYCNIMLTVSALGVAAPSGLEGVVKPRSTEQVRNFVKEKKRQNRLTHDALYNTYELVHQLPDFIRYFRLAPNLNLRVISGAIVLVFSFST